MDHAALRPQLGVLWNIVVREILPKCTALDSVSKSSHYVER